MLIFPPFLSPAWPASGRSLDRTMWSPAASKAGLAVSPLSDSVWPIRKCCSRRLLIRLQELIFMWPRSTGVHYGCRWHQPSGRAVCRLVRLSDSLLSLAVFKRLLETTLFNYVFSERELMFMFAICRRPSVCLSSVVCNVGAPYSGDWNFRQCFYAIWYLRHLRPFGKNFTEIVPGEPLRRGVKPKRGWKM